MLQHVSLSLKVGTYLLASAGEAASPPSATDPAAGACPFGALPGCGCAVTGGAACCPAGTSPGMHSSMLTWRFMLLSYASSSSSASAARISKMG